MFVAGEKVKLNLHSVVALNENGVNLLEYYRIRDIELYPYDQGANRNLISSPHDVRKNEGFEAKHLEPSEFWKHIPMTEKAYYRHFVSFTMRDAASVMKVVVINRFGENKEWSRGVIGGYVELRRKGHPVWQSPEIHTLQDVYVFDLGRAGEIPLQPDFLSSTLSPCVGGAGGAPFFDLVGDHPITEIRLYRRNDDFLSIEIQRQGATPTFYGCQYLQLGGVDLMRVRFEMGDVLIGVVVTYNNLVRNVQLRIRNKLGFVREEGFKMQLKEVVKTIELVAGEHKRIVGFNGRHGGRIDKLGVVFG
ncbi:hypothetical protein HDU96_006102 [Phlyctochytrium bullatum]|nr:hypothetical protein HDU96_006102 [Phlyctochytrium bullatum]